MTPKMTCVKCGGAMYRGGAQVDRLADGQHWIDGMLCICDHTELLPMDSESRREDRPRLPGIE